MIHPCTNTLTYWITDLAVIANHSPMHQELCLPVLLHSVCGKCVCKILYNNTRILGVCVFVCLCVCQTWDIRNGRSYRNDAYTILKSFAWRVAQTALRAYTTRGSREKAFGTYSPVTSRIPMHASLHFLLLWAEWILPTTWSLLNHSRRSHVEGHAHYTGTIVALTDIWQTRYTCLNDAQVEWKSIWKYFISDALNSMYARYTSRLPRGG